MTHAEFISLVNWTDRGVKNVKDTPNRIETVRAEFKKMGAEVKDMYVTTGAYDILLIAEAPDGDVMAKLAPAVGAQGNLRTTTFRGFTEAEFQQILADLP